MIGPFGVRQTGGVVKVLPPPDVASLLSQRKLKIITTKSQGFDDGDLDVVRSVGERE